MFLKNYTSDVPVPTTIMRIESILIKCGVKGIEKQYEDKTGRVLALTFTIDVGDNRPLRVNLPVREEQVLEALWQEYVDGDPLTPDGQNVQCYPNVKRKSRESFREQAQRTAWKLMQDWIEVQMSLILMKQADVREVFLSYILVNQKQTVFEVFQESGMKMLGNG